MRRFSLRRCSLLGDDAVAQALDGSAAGETQGVADLPAGRNVTLPALRSAFFSRRGQLGRIDRLAAAGSATAAMFSADEPDSPTAQVCGASTVAEFADRASLSRSPAPSTS